MTIGTGASVTSVIISDAPVVYVAIMKRPDGDVGAYAWESRRDAARYLGENLSRMGWKFLGTRAVPLEPDSEGTP